MIFGRLKGPAAGIRARCARCGFLRIVTGGTGPATHIASEEEESIGQGEAELWTHPGPPGNGDLCPRCLGDAWRYSHP